MKRPKLIVFRSGGNTPDVVIDPAARLPYVQVGQHAMRPADARALVANILKAADLAEKGN